MTAKDITDNCKHLLHGACGTCVESALATIALDAVLKYANNESHICGNTKLKPFAEMVCAGQCWTKPRGWLRDVVIQAAGRHEGWQRGRVDCVKAAPPQLREVLMSLEPPEDWGRGGAA